MKLAGLFRRNPNADAAQALYGAIVAQARAPQFYRGLGVPDTVDGRFDMVVIHVMMMMRRLRGGGREADALAQALFDLMFKDMDRSLREMGVGDMSVGRHVKKMAKAFYGRAEKYELGLDGDEAVLHGALAENLYRNAKPSDAQMAAMGRYMRAASAAVTAQELSAIMSGRVDLASVEIVHDASKS